MAEPHLRDRPEPRDVVRVPDCLFQDKDGLWHAEYDRFRLRSTFQPIYRLVDGKTLALEGFEGLVRPLASGREYRPMEFFSEVPAEEIFKVDRICRAIHFRNFALSRGGNRRIFVNMSPMTYRQFVDSAYDFQVTPQRLDRFGLSPKQAVIEIIETESMDFEVLLDVVEICRAMGASIALDDFGSRHSNVDRMIALKPDIVKLDYGLLREASHRTEVGELVRSLVGMAADYGADVVMEGIENRQELDFALSTRASLLQGYFIGPPSPRIALAPTQIDLEPLESQRPE